jgi:hypothetical protein
MIFSFLLSLLIFKRKEERKKERKKKKILKIHNLQISLPLGVKL